MSDWRVPITYNCIVAAEDAKEAKETAETAMNMKIGFKPQKIGKPEKILLMKPMKE